MANIERVYDQIRRTPPGNACARSTGASRICSGARALRRTRCNSTTAAPHAATPAIWATA